MCRPVLVLTVWTYVLAVVGAEKPTLCPQGTYGSECQFSCSKHCKTDLATAQQVCHHNSGDCVLGCQSGYRSPKCHEKLSYFNSQDPEIEIGIGVAVGVTILIILAGVVSVYFYNKRVNPPVTTDLTVPYQDGLRK